MRIVLDTNVLVSGMLAPYGPPGEIVRLVAMGDLYLCYDVRILAEYREVLLRPVFPFGIDQVEASLEQIESSGELTGARSLSTSLPDPDDDMFLAVAIAGRAEYLVTGNLRHYPAESRQGIKVISPAEFLERYRQG